MIILDITSHPLHSFFIGMHHESLPEEAFLSEDIYVGVESIDNDTGHNTSRDLTLELVDTRFSSSCSIVLLLVSFLFILSLTLSLELSFGLCTVCPPL